MLFRKKRTPLTREQSLRSVPIKNQSVEETKTESGEIVLYLIRRDVWWIKVLAKTFYVPKGRKISLDELGSTVWGWLDGKTNVHQVIKRFAEKYKLSKREAELSVAAYLKTLAKRGLIGIAVLDPPLKSGRKGTGKRRTKRK